MSKLIGTFRRRWEAVNFAEEPMRYPGHHFIEVGTYTLERINHPTIPGVTCLVVAGTLIGMAEAAMRQWAEVEEDAENAEWRIDLVEISSQPHSSELTPGERMRMEEWKGMEW